MLKRLRSQDGMTLLELIVGSAIALLVLGTILRVELSAWRYRGHDENRFTVQATSRNVLDRLLLDVRLASGVAAIGDDGASVTLIQPGGSVTYQHDAATRELERIQGSERTVVGRDLQQITFTLEPQGGLQIALTTRLADGSTYAITGSGSFRNRSGGS